MDLAALVEAATEAVLETDLVETVELDDMADDLMLAMLLMVEAIEGIVTVLLFEMGAGMETVFLEDELVLDWDGTESLEALTWGGRIGRLSFELLT